MSADNKWRPAEIEVTNNRIVVAIIDAGNLNGWDINIFEYDRENAIVVASLFTGECPRKTYSLTPDWAFYGDVSQPNGKVIRLDKTEDQKDLKICDQFRKLILEHDEQLAKRLPVFQPS